jgi:hypothetical protein
MLAADLAAAPQEFEHDGKRYRLHVLTDRLRGKWERTLQRIAVENTAALKPHITAAEYREALADLRRDFGAGLYAFGGEVHGRYVETPAGFAAFLRVMLDDDTLTDDAVLALAAAKGDTIDALFQSLYPGLKDSAPDPQTAAGAKA